MNCLSVFDHFVGLTLKGLRYFLTFKVRKSESFFTKLIRVSKNYSFHWIADNANILIKYIIYIFFNFGRGFCGSFPMLFPKVPASCSKKFLN